MVPNALLLLASQILSRSHEATVPWAAMHCVNPKKSFVDYLSLSFITLWVIFAFINRIINISGKERKLSNRSWMFEKVVDYYKLQPKDASQGWPNNLQILNEKIKNEKKNSKIARKVMVIDFFLTDIMSSLAWEINWLCFSFAYGLSGTIITWISCSQPTDEFGYCWGSVMQMGLGQMIPLILLILPVFAILESFSKCDVKFCQLSYSFT
jgi:hypothetical protein